MPETASAHRSGILAVNPALSTPYNAVIGESQAETVGTIAETMGVEAETVGAIAETVGAMPKRSAGMFPQALACLRCA